MSENETSNNLSSPAPVAQTSFHAIANVELPASFDSSVGDFEIWLKRFNTFYVLLNLILSFSKLAEQLQDLYVKPLSEFSKEKIFFFHL
jgi:hypothetical protein